MPARENASASGRANGPGRVALSELHAGGGQLIDIWRFIELTAETADISPAQVIDKEEKEIGLFRLRQWADPNEKEREARDRNSTWEGIHGCNFRAMKR